MIIFLILIFIHNILFKSYAKNYAGDETDRLSLKYF